MKYSEGPKQHKMRNVGILEAFNVSNLGLLTEIKHRLQGLPAGTILLQKETPNSWTVAKRVLNGELITSNNEIYFDCEECTHISHRYNSPEKRQEAIRLEMEKRKKGIYWYLLVPNKMNAIAKPGKGVELEIEVKPNNYNQKKVNT